MAETLLELVVALSLDSSNFSHNIRTINQQQRAKAHQEDLRFEVEAAA